MLLKRTASAVPQTICFQCGFSRCCTLFPRRAHTMLQPHIPIHEMRVKPLTYLLPIKSITSTWQVIPVNLLYWIPVMKKQSPGPSAGVFPLGYDESERKAANKPHAINILQGLNPKTPESRDFSPFKPNKSTHNYFLWKTLRDNSQGEGSDLRLTPSPASRTSSS